MQVQQLELKLFAAGVDASFDQEPLIAIFHQWIRENRLGDVLLIDVADYRHVPNGPGVMIVGDGVHWKMDSDRGELGFAFARKRDQVGDLDEKLAEAFTHLTSAVVALESEPALAGALRFDRNHGLVTVMSRLAATNDQNTYDLFAQQLQAFLGDRFAGREVTTERVSQDPREPLTVRFRLS